MNKIQRITTIVLLSFYWFSVPAQERLRILTESEYDSILVNEDELIEISNDSVSIHVLMMAKGSTLRFKQPTWLSVENAFIGTGCVFDASAEPLAESKQKRPLGEEGSTGNNGFSLNVQITFLKLGQLLINTQGGRGTNGEPGVAGGDGQDGTIGGNDGENGRDGGRGGDGGDAGDLTLSYKCIGFVAAINDKRRKQNVINLQFDGGRGGRGGNGGRGGMGGRPRDTGRSDPNGKTVTSYVGTAGRNGLAGKPGVSGKDGKQGELRIIRLE